MHVEPRQEHGWLERMVGDWTYEGECRMGPDQPPMKISGVETVRSVGGLWMIAEGEAPSPDGSGSSKSVMTLGFDPDRGRFVGTFIASMMTYLWTYDGALEESGRALVLDAEGPAMTGTGMAKYHDRIEFVDDDHRILSSEMLGDDGRWHQFMATHYYRKK